MNTEDKELFICDSCARFLYGVKGLVYAEGHAKDGIVREIGLGALGLIEDGHSFLRVRLYLRSLSSLSESELEEYESLKEDLEASAIVPWKCFKFLDWCYKHHLDINGLIEMGLALEAPEGMYKNE